MMAMRRRDNKGGAGRQVTCQRQEGRDSGAKWSYCGSSCLGLGPSHTCSCNTLLFVHQNDFCPTWI